MRISVRERVLTVVTCVMGIAFSAASAAAQQPPTPTPPPAAAAQPAAPAQVQAQPAQAPAAAPAYPPPPAAQPAPGQYPPPPGAYAYPPGAYPPGAYPPGAYPPPPGGVQYAPGYDYRAERKPRRPRRSRGMMIAGIALFAGGYLPPAIIGLGVGTQDRKECDCRDALRLLIPVAGPLTLWKPNRDLNFFFNTLMVLDSLVQTAGVVLTVFGIMRYSESVADEEELGQLRPKPKPSLSFGAVPLPGGAYGSLRLQL